MQAGISIPAEDYDAICRSMTKYESVAGIIRTAIIAEAEAVMQGLRQKKSTEKKTKILTFRMTFAAERALKTLIEFYETSNISEVSRIAIHNYLEGK